MYFENFKRIKLLCSSLAIHCNIYCRWKWHKYKRWFMIRVFSWDDKRRKLVGKFWHRLLCDYRWYFFWGLMFIMQLDIQSMQWNGNNKIWLEDFLRSSRLILKCCFIAVSDEFKAINTLYFIHASKPLCRPKFLCLFLFGFRSFCFCTLMLTFFLRKGRRSNYHGAEKQ